MTDTEEQCVYAFSTLLCKLKIVICIINTAENSDLWPLT